ncbi:S8 family peptidase [Chlorobaculum thiosulfatiphilum]|uniref:S8 family peptidase n=1 Tax=Chlorobaculum thiosulfatiphilum TaxID=115852 RepID=A0A5C4S6I0_CHLTI|nr:S8 family peptidase [Chlorobaculum thiosulfatiphilum]TNJ39036.1 S8 family peptidase [Chlorobaculum thiosulfatiphilum]
MANEYPHIFLHDVQQSSDYTTPRSGGGNQDKLPTRERQVHSIRLQEQWAAIWTRAREEQASRIAVSMPVKNGVYIEFEGAAGYELVTKSLEHHTSGIRLLNVRKDLEQKITRATVFIPMGKQDFFLKKILEYAQKETLKGHPRHDELIRSVQDMRLAVLDSFWIDKQELLPQGELAVWCEIWLQGEAEKIEKKEIEQRFRDIALFLGIEVKERTLRFPERAVLLGRTTREQLVNLIASSPDIAEFRRAKETARFFLELENRDQTEWVADLRARLRINQEPNVAVCVLDTGVNNGHELLASVLADKDRHAVNPDWGLSDHNGHGTLMSGVVAFGDLTEVLPESYQIQINHCLESVKILPPYGENDPDLYGYVTVQGMSYAAIQAPERIRIGCMAVTSKDWRDFGKPSSWSAAIDQFTSGYDDVNRCLMIVSAGNISDSVDWESYPDSNLNSFIHDPGQSWNALTVGAYTQKALLSDPDFDGYVPLAEPDQLSPFSTTSRTWESEWPVKPDIVMEGGNLAKAPDDFISESDDLSLLSTCYQPTRRQFDKINATSAAAAQAARMAAQLQVRYPNAWPETIRGLMIHSADWPEALKRQFMTADRRGEYSKTEYGNLLRICGYGVPSLSKALACASNSLTLIAEAEIQPYKKKDNNSGYVTNEMHLYELPWPREVLLMMETAPVKLRITLSYFIEPGPGEVGWKDKYRYASYGLRFDLNSRGENKDEFMKRLNKAVRDDDEDKPDTNSDRDRWIIGKKKRDFGSVQSDIWNGTAVDIATCNLVGVYPLIGWWRERPHLQRWDRKARYSLIVSLHTPDETIDIYTPVATQIGVPVQIPV